MQVTVHKQGSGHKVKYSNIAVRSLTCHTATGTHVPYRIIQVGGVALWLAAFVAWTKLMHVGSG